MSLLSLPKKTPTNSGENIRTDQFRNESSSAKSTPSVGKQKPISSIPHVTKIIGVLQELKDDIVDESLQHHKQSGDFIYHIPCNEVGPKTGLTDLYVEQNGRFTKGAKDISEQDFGNVTRYFQSVEAEDNFNTPLDMAIFSQKMWNVMSKILFGILAGIAVYDLIILHFQLKISNNWDKTEKFLDMYSPLAFLITKFYHIILTVCLITLFDWFDLAHMNLQHLTDTLKFRKIWIVAVVFLAVLTATLYNFSSDDMMILYDDIKDQMKNFENLDNTLYYWMLVRKISCWCCIVGWVMIVMTNNDDLFLIHLMAMKKYDCEENIHQVYENINATDS